MTLVSCRRPCDWTWGKSDLLSQSSDSVQATPLQNPNYSVPKNGSRSHKNCYPTTSLGCWEHGHIKSLCVATALWERFLNPRPSHLAHRNEVELYTVVHMNIYWCTDHVKGYSDLVTWHLWTAMCQDFHEHVKSGKLLGALHELLELCLPINLLKPTWYVWAACVNFSIRRRCFFMLNSARWQTDASRVILWPLKWLAKLKFRIIKVNLMLVLAAFCSSKSLAVGG